VAAYLALKDRPKLSVRTGSVNAGHTVVYDGKTYKLRLTPSAFVNPSTQLRIAAGANVDLAILRSEMDYLGLAGRLKVDSMTSVIEAHHINEDRSDAFLKGVIGTTGSGVGPAIADRVRRRARLAKDFDELRGLTTDVSEEVHSILDSGGTVHLEGSQGFYLSLYHGTYPFVTGRDTTAAAVLSEVGVGPKMVSDVVLVLKSYMTRVGEGPLPGELDPREAAARGWSEKATVTGRTRRAAPFDFKLARRAARVNGATSIAVTKLDILFPECSSAKAVDGLPPKCLEFLRRVEVEVGVPVRYVSTGPDTSEMVLLK
jgi:adenylosuccinate synthase